ncbi:MAG: glycosyltransferase family 4 protein [Patescibacteria group bacterium]|nr:glycosyltransferase family 4 protein [Patescibacteria group bacterium]
MQVRKRILIFALTYHPYVGGAEVAIKEITDRMGPDAYSFDMITLRFDRALPRVEKKGNITVHRIGFAANAPKISERAMPLRCKLSKALFPITSFIKALSLNRTLRQGLALPQGERGYDIVWAMMANQAGFGALLFKIAHPRIPYFLELQDGRSLEHVRKRRPITTFVWPLYSAIYRYADVIKVISHFIERLAREVGYRGPLEVIPNGVDVERFSANIPEERLAALKSRLEIRLGDIVLFTASRLVLSRGVEDVILSLTHLPLEVKLLIAGDGEDRAKLEGIAREAGVESRVIFAGQVDHAELPAYFKVSDIFVRPSLIEGMGNAFVEAFAAGIPVVATPVGGIPDFLTDGETGVFCEVHAPESVARAVKRYMDDPALLAKVVKNAKALAAQKYDWDLIAKSMRERIFQPLLPDIYS